MKKLLCFLLVLAICASLMSTAVFAANTNVYDGYDSLKLTNYTTGAPFVAAIGKSISVTPNTDYTISAWSKGSGGAAIRIFLGDWKGTTKDISLPGGGVWQKVQTTINSGSTTIITFTFVNNSYSSAGTRYVDDLFFGLSGGTNLVPNPGFENNGSSWSLPKSITVSGQSVVYGDLEVSDTPMDPGGIVVPYEDNYIYTSDNYQSLGFGQNNPPMGTQWPGNNSLNLYSGHYSLQYNASDTQRRVYQNVALKDDANVTQYKTSFQIKGTNGGQIKFDVKNSAGTDLFTETITTTGTWQRIERLVTTGQERNITYGFSTLTGQTGQIFIDYCMIIPAKKPVGVSWGNMISNNGFESGNASGVTNWTGIDGTDFIRYEYRGNNQWGDVSGGVRLMAVGDSITAGVGSSSDKAGYKRPLYESLTSYGDNVNFVGPNPLGASTGFPDGSGHAGNSGWTIPQVRSNIDSWMKAYQPQVITLMIGTNDIGLNTDWNTLTVPGIQQRLVDLVNRIIENDPSIKLYLAKLTWRGGGLDQYIQQFNPIVDTIAAAHPNNVRVVNMFDAVPHSSSYFPDYTHPNDSGYALMAQTWFAASKDEIKNMTPRIVGSGSPVYDGNYSMVYNPYYAPKYTVLGYETLQYTLNNLEPNTDYNVSMMVRGQQGVSCDLRVNGTFGGDTIKTASISGSSIWSKYEFTFNTGNRTMVILTWTNTSTSAGYLYFDCVEAYKNESDVNLITNPSMELDDQGVRTGWNGGNDIFYFVKDTTFTDPFHENISITKNGTKLTKLETGQIDISADISSLNPSGVLIAALYEGQTFKNCVVSTPGTNLSVSIPVNTVDQDTKLKILIFDSTDNIRNLMLPLTATPLQIK